MTPAWPALFYDLVSYDTIVRNGRWFDGTGAPSAVRNIGIRGGHVVAITPQDLDDEGRLRLGQVELAPQVGFADHFGEGSVSH